MPPLGNRRRRLRAREKRPLCPITLAGRHHKKFRAGGPHEPQTVSGSARAHMAFTAGSLLSPVVPI